MRKVTIAWGKFSSNFALDLILPVNVFFLLILPFCMKNGSRAQKKLNFLLNTTFIQNEKHIIRFLYSWHIDSSFPQNDSNLSTFSIFKYKKKKWKKITFVVLILPTNAIFFPTYADELEYIYIYLIQSLYVNYILPAELGKKMH